MNMRQCSMKQQPALWQHLHCYTVASSALATTAVSCKQQDIRYTKLPSRYNQPPTRTRRVRVRVYWHASWLRRGERCGRGWGEWGAWGAGRSAGVWRGVASRLRGGRLPSGSLTEWLDRPSLAHANIAAVTTRRVSHSRRSGNSGAFHTSERSVRTRRVSEVGLHSNMVERGGV